MSLVVYPLENAESYISVVDADTIITNKSVQSATWLALSEQEKEVYLRISYDFIIATCDSTLLPDWSIPDDVGCLAEVNALMASRDLVYSISSSINPNTGLIKRERVDTIEVEYDQSNNNGQGVSTTLYDPSFKTCLVSYGYSPAVSGVQQMVLGKS